MDIVTFKSEHNYKELSGDEFNKEYADIHLVKLTNLIENHNGLEYKDGLNIDKRIFNPMGACESGGIYCVPIQNAHLWLTYDNIKYSANGYDVTSYTILPMIFMRKVTIPNDARLYIENNKLKTDKIILEPKSMISKEIYLKGIMAYTTKIQYIPKQLLDKEMCMVSVKRNAFTLKDVPIEFRDVDVCIEALLQNTIQNEDIMCYVPISQKSAVINIMRQIDPYGIYGTY